MKKKIRLPKTVTKEKEQNQLETIEIDKNGMVIGWCKVLRKLKLLRCGGRCSTCYCG